MFEPQSRAGQIELRVATARAAELELPAELAGARRLLVLSDLDVALGASALTPRGRRDFWLVPGAYRALVLGADGVELARYPFAVTLSSPLRIALQ